MVGSHFLALVPLLILLVLSLVFYGKGLVHLITLGYSGVLAFVAISGGWENLVFPPITGTVVIALLLFIYSMTEGNWL